MDLPAAPLRSADRLFQMKLAVTPLFRSDIGDGFREVPVVSVKVLGIVLSFPIGMILRFAQDDSPVLPCACTVANSIFDTHLNALRMIRRHIPFADREAALSRFHLYAVIGNTQTNAKAESF